MAVRREQIILRRGRRNGDKMPHRVSLKELSEGDSLVVEIIIDRKNDLVSRYHFLPENLAGRKSVAFRVVGDTVYWLSGLQPKPMFESQVEKLFPKTDVKKADKAVVERKPRVGNTKPRNFKVLTFGDNGELIAIYRSVNEAAALTNLREKAIDRLCKTKRQSTETGYLFRYWWKVLDFDIAADFALTVAQYDELCKRKASDK